jgi:hypothetical protein
MNIPLKRIAVVGGMVALGTGAWGSPALGASVMHPKPATVTVDNARDVPVVVYLEQGPFDTRIGTVAPHSKSVLDLPSIVTGQKAIQFVVHPEGDRDLLSPDLIVRPGGNVDLYVPTNDMGFIPLPPPEVIPNPGKGTTTLTVENPRDQDVVVFIERGDFDTRIGTVRPQSDTTFYLSGFLARQEHSVEIFVHPENGMDLASHEFELKPDAHLFLKVPQELGRGEGT